MTPEERQLLNTLAERIRSVPPQQKDPEADQFLRQLAQERPDTGYVLAQTVIMQDFALRNAQAQIEELQRQLAEAAPPQQRPGSFLGGLFGGSAAPQPSTSHSGSVPRVNADATAGPGSQPRGYHPDAMSGPGPQAGPGYGYGGPTMQPSQTGDFLRNAASTAAGVAGGALLFQGISSLFSGHHGGLINMNPFGSGGHQSLSETTIAGSQRHDSGVDQSRDAADYGDRDDIMNADYGDDGGMDFDDDGTDYA